MGKRTLIIGDVHGCIDELRDLIEELDYCPDTDDVYFIGDLINKGPSSLEVFTLFQSLNAVSIMGNHEAALLAAVRGERDECRRVEQLREEFGEMFNELIESIEQWPHFVRLPGALLVHAGIPPGHDPEDVDLHTLVNIRTWDGSGEILHAKDDPPWFDLYDGEDHVVFGHWAALKGIQTEKYTGLDTGCVYGGHLSALILEEHTLVKVPARRVYEEIG